MKIKDYLEQAKYIKRVDPACKSTFEALFLYPVNKVIFRHNIARWFYKKGRHTIARWISQGTRKKTGIEVHPGATLGKYLFIDHGMGVVIGETAVIGDRCTLYHGVTLGGTGNETSHFRHPQIGDDVIIGAGATILGPVKIGNRAKIGANAVVLVDVPDDATAVGTKSRIIEKINKV